MLGKLPEDIGRQFGSSLYVISYLVTLIIKGFSLVGIPWQTVPKKHWLFLFLFLNKPPNLK